MGDVDWASLRRISCDDVLSKLCEVLPDATVQAQRSAIERGWDFTVQMPQLDGRWFHMGLTDEGIEDKAGVERAVVSLIGQVHAAMTAVGL